MWGQVSFELFPLNSTHVVNNIKIVEVTWDRNISRICLKCDSIRTTMGWFSRLVCFCLVMFCFTNYIYIYVYEYVCAYICAIYIYVHTYVLYMCMCVCVYSNSTINTESTFLFCTKSRRQWWGPWGTGLSHAVRGGTEGFHGLFKLLEVFLTLIFTFI